MSNTGGRNLDGSQFNNISLVSECGTNGSLEASGTIYVNSIQEYDILSGVTIDSSIFRSGGLTINSTVPAINNTTAALIINGGAYISGDSIINGILRLSNTTNSIDTSSGSLIVSGGLSINRDVNIGGFLNMNNNLITNVTSPSNLLDVANKYYVDTQLANFTSSSINGNFTQGQVIVGSTGGGLIGYPTFIFDGVLLSLNSTVNATSLTDAGTFLVSGGMAVQGSLYTNGIDNNNKKITNVDLPTQPLDVVNKEYVDYYLGINNGDIYQRSFVLSNNVFTATDVVGFKFDNLLVSSFEAIVYLQIPELNVYDQWKIHGVLKGSIWSINTTFIGDMPNVTFSIYNTGTHGQMQYTNLNSTGTATLYFRAITTSFGNYTNITLGNIVHQVPNGGTGQEFFSAGSILIGNDIYSLNTSSDLQFLNNTLYLGNTNNAISITEGGSLTVSGGISVAKNLIVGDFINIGGINILPSQGDIFTEQIFSINNNTVIPTAITNFLFLNSVVKYFHAFVSISVIANINMSAGYELKGISTDTGWKMNVTYIGDNIPVNFYINVSGQIQYTMSNIPGFVSGQMRFRALTTSV